MAYVNTRNIYKLATDGNLLYVFFSDCDEIVVMRKTIGGGYVFSEINIEI